MNPAPPWELWSSDLFDRESPPTHEGSFATAREGLAALWRAVLHEGVQDDGRPSFTSFSLRAPAPRSVQLPRDPFQNPELAQLRARRAEVDFTLRLAAAHEVLLDQAFSFAPLLALPVVLPAPVARVAQFLAETLGDADVLTTRASGWRCGARVDVSFGAPREWRVSAEGLHVTLVEERGAWTHALSTEGPASALVLRDALLAAGW